MVGNNGDMNTTTATRIAARNVTPGMRVDTLDWRGRDRNWSPFTVAKVVMVPMRNGGHMVEVHVEGGGFLTFTDGVHDEVVVVA